MAIKKEKPLSPRKIASYCQVNFKTVLTWIEKGQLKSAYKLPGGSNRIAREDVVEFLFEYNLPIPHDLEPNAGMRVQLISDDASLSADMQKLLINNNYVLKISDTLFDAGLCFACYKPNKVIIDMDFINNTCKHYIDLINSRATKRKYEKVNIICMAQEFSIEAKSMLLSLGVSACVEKSKISEQLIGLL